MFPEFILWLPSVALWLGMVLLTEVGRRDGRRRLALDPKGASSGTGAVDATVFGLLGLLIAFTFSGAAARFDTRRHLIVEETNAIGTAYLRLDLLPAVAQPALRESFRRYLDSRLRIYQLMPDVGAAKGELARSALLQGEIWNQAISACSADAPPPATMLLLPALNAMFDITTARTVAAQTHPPVIIFGILFGLALVGSLLAGYDMAAAKTRSLLHILGFATVMAVTVFVIIDLEFPRAGLIRVDAVDQALVELRASMD